MSEPNVAVTAAGHRVLTARVHTLGELGEGAVEGYASAYGVTFTEGGFFFRRRVRMRKGMFADSLSERSSFPIMWEHDWDAGPLGHTTSTDEDDKGLRFNAQLYVDGERGKNAWRSMEAGALTEWSVAFYPRGHELIDDEDDGDIIEYTKGDLIEITSALRGANPGTETISVQSGRAAPGEIILDGVRYVADHGGRPHTAHAAAGPHDTEVRSGEWSRSENEARLPSPVSLSTARRFYAAWDSDAVEDGAVPKSAGHLPHHFVDSGGQPGAASINGVRAALARLNQTDISESERSTAERHLRAHQNDFDEREQSALVDGAERLLARPSVRDLLRTQVA